MIMEVDFVTSDILEAESIEVDDNNENSNFEGERCGICMDIIFDRGVLDCCQHWFCFTCIDNWATITNLCPLCQSEFQSITCVPVYDTIGNNTIDDDDTLSGDDEWCIEGKNDNLPLPSYYIDENAVVCLDGDRCKIRSGSANMTENFNLDTSIACDSCDIWYHAFCVGFDPEGTSEDTWLCPRCLAGEVPLKSEPSLVHRPSNQCGPGSCQVGFTPEATFSGKFSVFVADAGETAVVVSRIDSNKRNEEACEKFHSTLEGNENLQIDAVDGSSVKEETPCGEKNEIQQILEAQGLELSSPVHHLKNNGTECRGTGDVKQQSLAEEHFLSDEKIICHANEEAVKMIGPRRKHTDCRTAADKEGSSKNEDASSRKKVRTKEKFQLESEDQPNEFLDDSHGCPAQVAASNIVKPNKSPKEEEASPDIMSIVRGIRHRPSKGLAKQSPDMSSKERENVAGLRVKKIMRRATEDKESSTVVQQLRTEIREAVCKKASANTGESLFDPNLLAAFRTAVAGPATEAVEKLPTSALKAKKSLLQKGKIRENLTKKIYGNSNGRRKRAWDRECEVEFWKHRCMRASKPEKIATLKSVLNLLKKNPEGSESEQTSESQAANPILSRLYLADTSVFPRKENIKPLSALTAASNSEKSHGQLTSTETGPNPSLDDRTQKNITVANRVPSVNDTGYRDKIPLSKDKVGSSKPLPIKASSGSLQASLGGSKVNSQKETGTASDDKKIDKRKWALEVLARKKAATGTNVMQEKQEDNAMLKGYPLLAQLPADMRPVLAPSRHNKIPVSVRQTQLYRLMEHFLRKANLLEIRRTAETELAVADAVNIEKEVADKSNSKLVYLNLCSQEISRRSDNIDSSRAKEPLIPSQPVNHSEQANELPTDSAVIDALKNAGLLSESPPSSPFHNREVSNDVGDIPIQSSEEGPDNILEMDSNPEADIYGDFEYDLEDEDYFGAAAAMKVPRPLEEAESRMRLVFSTLKPETSNDIQVFEDKLEDVGESNQQNGYVDAGITRSTTKGGGDESCFPPEMQLNEEGAELSLVECEELYGPDKEPLIHKFPEETPKELNGLVAKASVEKKASDGVNCTSIGSGQSLCDGENSSTHSGTSEKISRKDSSNTETSRQNDATNSVSKKVEVYIKEHIRPLCKSGIITVEQYRWAVAKTTDKVMKYHLNAKNANFLIKEGEKVKKLAERYVETAQQKEKNDLL